MTGQGPEVLPVATGRATLAAVAGAARKVPSLLVSTALFAVLASLVTIATPLLLGRVVDVVIDAVGRQQLAEAYRRLTVLVVALSVSVLATAVFTSLALRQAERLASFIAADLREQVVQRSLRMDPKVLERAGAGDVTTRVTEDIELFTTAIPTVSGVITALVTVLLSIGGFVSLDWRLALAFFAVVPVYAFSLRSYLPKARPLYAAERLRASERSRVLLESVHGARTVHAYGMGALQSGRVERASITALEAGLAARRRFALLAMSMNWAEAVGLSAVVTAGFFAVRAELVSVGAVTAAVLLFHRLFGPLGMLLMSFDQVQRASAALARIVGVTTLPIPVGSVAAPRRAATAVSIRGVRHRYGADEVLHGIDLDVPAGSSLAVVGESGAGKTTLAAIVAGVFPATDGSVGLAVAGAADGAVEVPDLAPDDLRELVAMVSQESHTFAGTVAEDLRLARPDAPDDELWRVLALVGAAPWVRVLPDGLETRVGTGGFPLTAAQEQHLALARVALRDPAVVVLDEATAEANSAGARELEDAAARLLEGRTALVVAHRLTQARACDRIAVMHEGRVVELGSHDELLAGDGRYRRLWSMWSST